MEDGGRTSGTEPTDPQVLEFARRKVWAMTDPGTAERWAEDIASEVFIEYKLASARTDLEIRNWRGWVGSAVRSRLFAERRRERMRQKVHETYVRGALRTHADPEPVEVAQGREAIIELDGAMRSLRSRKQKQVLALSYFKGMTSAEIGEVLGMSPESVRGCKKRAIEKLRLAHQDRGFDEALMGVEIGVAATVALLQKQGPKDWTLSMASQVSDAVQGTVGSAKQLAARITGSGSSSGQAGDAATGTAAGVGGAAGTAAAVGGGKLIGAVCAGVGTVCVAGALVTGVGPGLPSSQDEPSPRSAETAPRVEPVATPTEAERGTASDSGGTDSRSINRDRSNRPSPNRVVTQSESPTTSGPASVATPAEAAEAFGPPIGGQTSARSSTAGGSAGQGAGQGSSGGSNASASDAAQAFGPLP